MKSQVVRIDPDALLEDPKTTKRLSFEVIQELHRGRQAFVQNLLLAVGVERVDDASTRAVLRFVNGLSDGEYNAVMHGTRHLRFKHTIGIQSRLAANSQICRYCLLHGVKLDATVFCHPELVDKHHIAKWCFPKHLKGDTLDRLVTSGMSPVNALWTIKQKRMSFVREFVRLTTGKEIPEKIPGSWSAKEIDDYLGCLSSRRLGISPMVILQLLKDSFHFTRELRNAWLGDLGFYDTPFQERVTKEQLSQSLDESVWLMPDDVIGQEFLLPKFPKEGNCISAKASGKPVIGYTRTVRMVVSDKDVQLVGENSNISLTIRVPEGFSARQVTLLPKDGYVAHIVDLEEHKESHPQHLGSTTEHFPPREHV